jgi:hypothetical protein
MACTPAHKVVRSPCSLYSPALCRSAAPHVGVRRLASGWAFTVRNGRLIPSRRSMSWKTVAPVLSRPSHVSGKRSPAGPIEGAVVQGVRQPKSTAPECIE